jgi:hypothetical protein
MGPSPLPNVTRVRIRITHEFVLFYVFDILLAFYIFLLACRFLEQLQ